MCLNIYWIHPPPSNNPGGDCCWVRGISKKRIYIYMYYIYTQNTHVYIYIKLYISYIYIYNIYIYYIYTTFLAKCRGYIYIYNTAIYSCLEDMVASFSVFSLGNFRNFRRISPPSRPALLNLRGRCPKRALHQQFL